MLASGRLLLVLLGCLIALRLVGAGAVGLQLDDGVLSHVQLRYGSEARTRVERLKQLLGESAGRSEQDKLASINGFFNRIPFSSDRVLWGATDYWATPIEMLGIDGADCEDYAIAKYFALRELGVADRKLRITYVWAVELGQAHMVLAYYPTPNAEPTILDNLENSIRPAGERTDLVPVYSFNGADLWLSKSRTRGEKAGSSSRIKNWNALRARMFREADR